MFQKFNCTRGTVLEVLTVGVEQGNSITRTAEKYGKSQDAVKEKGRLAFIAAPLSSAEKYSICGKRASRLW